MTSLTRTAIQIGHVMSLPLIIEALKSARVYTGVTFQNMDATKRYPCIYCSVEGRARLLLAKHLVPHMQCVHRIKLKKKAAKCQYCDKSTPTEVMMFIHVINKHGHSRPHWSSRSKVNNGSFRSQHIWKVMTMSWNKRDLTNAVTRLWLFLEV